ncbi:MAG: PLP-dependent aminotransferase family protein [Proteobacteria bacterium]|nr:PLP-dependent aminotransferase family protein [Pseudomonadota bacterium]
MRVLSLQIPKDSRARYLRIADAVRAAIRVGRAKPGELMPSLRELSRFVGSHRFTIMAAMNELVAEGWLEAEPRRGYRVHGTLPDAFMQSQAAGLAAPGGGSREASRDGSASLRAIKRFRIARRVRAEDAPVGTPKPFNFKSGYPDLRRFPTAEFKSCLWDAIKLSGRKLMTYGDPAGHPELVEAISTYLRRARAIPERPVLVTHGSQEAIFLAAQLLLKPGDKVAVEALGYPPAWDAFRAAGAKLLPVRVDGSGIDPDDLERVARRNRLRLLYVTPLHQYPTTVTLPVSRRLRLYEIASRRGIVILEDDYDHEFHFRSQPPAPLAASDPDGRVIYASSFSKSVFPSARVGFLAVPRPLAAAARGLRRIVTRQNDALMQDAFARWMRSGGLERHLRRMRRVYHERRDAFAAMLDETARGDFEWTVPDGGMALWLDAKADARKAAEAAARLGVAVTPESGLVFDGSNGTHLRLGFAHHEPHEARQGLSLLLKAIRKARR